MTTRPHTFITAAPSSDPSIAAWNRRNLRFHYRSLRMFGMSRFLARHTVTGIIRATRTEVKP